MKLLISLLTILLVDQCAPPCIAQCDDLFPGRCTLLGFAPTTTDIFSADLDNDLKEDLLVAVPNAATRNLLVLKNLGSGNYADAVGYTVLGAARCVRTIDLNNDGLLDVVVGCRISETAPASLAMLYGRTDGTLAEPVYLNLPAGYSVGNLLIADFDGNASPDLLVGPGLTAAGNLLFYPNLGGGVFGPVQIISQSGQTGQAAVADFDGDGDLDVLQPTTTLGLLSNNGSGSFQAFSRGSVANPRMVAVGDVDHDGDIDAVVSCSPGPSKLCRNNGLGVFTFSDLPGGLSNWACFVDLDSDSDLDLIGCGGGFDGEGITVMYNGGGGAFDLPRLYGAGDLPSQIFLADHDGDGDLDVTVVDSVVSAAMSVSVLMNLGDGVLNARRDYGVVSFPRIVAAGDLNGDGFPDLAINGYSQSQGASGVTTLLNLDGGSGVFGLARQYASPARRGVALADVDRDGDLDIMAGSAGGTVTPLINTGNGILLIQTSLSMPLGTHIGLKDLDGDADHDLVTVGEINGLAVSKNNGAGAFGNATTYLLGGTGSQVEFGDFNNDGLIDAVASLYSTNSVCFLRGLGNAAFASPASMPSGPQPYSIAIGDFDTDGNSDFVVANSNDSVNSAVNRWGSLNVFFGNGDGSFSSPLSISTDSNPYYVAVADFDGDGVPDIVASNVEAYSGGPVGRGTLTLHRSAGDRTFLSLMRFKSDMQPFCISVADLDHDQNLDLAVANYCPTNNAASTISVFKSKPISPRISRQPASIVVCRNATAQFSVRAAVLNPRTFSWRKNSIPIDPGLNPSAATPSLAISNLRNSDIAEYDCVVTGSCGSITTQSATLQLCLADFNCDSTVDFFDYLDFVSAFASGSTSSDFNGDGAVDLFDYLDFIVEMSAGC